MNVMQKNYPGTLYCEVTRGRTESRKCPLRHGGCGMSDILEMALGRTSTNASFMNDLNVRPRNFD